MAFTQEEEEILKLMVAEKLASLKYSKANRLMGDEIRTEFNVVDSQVRATWQPIIDALTVDKVSAEKDLEDKVIVTSP